jgi:hypothetical protein
MHGLKVSGFRFAALVLSAAVGSAGFAGFIASFATSYAGNILEHVQEPEHAFFKFEHWCVMCRQASRGWCRKLQAACRKLQAAGFGR